MRSETVTLEKAVHPEKGVIQLVSSQLVLPLTVYVETLYKFSVCKPNPQMELACVCPSFKTTCVAAVTRERE